MVLKKYPDGTSYFEGSPESHRDHVFKVNSYEDLWHLNQFVDNYVSVTDGLIPTIVIPNLIDAQADRRFAFNQSTGLKLVCEFLNSMKAKFKIFHPHNPEVVEAVMNRVEIIDNNEFITKVLRYNLPDDGQTNNPNLILMSSDAGGFKPLMKLCDKIGWRGETFSASKSRKWTKDGSTLDQRIDRDDFEGKDILIIDDISVYGGTFKGLSTKLRDKNVGKLYLAVSHMTMQNLGSDPLTNYFDKVFTTNSKYDNYYKKTKNGGTQPENLEIIKLF